MTTPEEILGFWLDEVGPEGWYAEYFELDATIRERFGAAWEQARAGKLGGWCTCPEGTLALLILLDQFPRNMFRGDPRSFATDGKALAVAKRALRLGYPERMPAPARQFFYLPLMHSELLPDQERCLRRVLLDPELQHNVDHARAHREVIRQFGRFPYRNTALGRRSTASEQAFLNQGGYASAMETVKAA